MLRRVWVRGWLSCQRVASSSVCLRASDTSRGRGPRWIEKKRAARVRACFRRFSSSRTLPSLLLPSFVTDQPPTYPTTVRPNYSGILPNREEVIPKRKPRRDSSSESTATITVDCGLIPDADDPSTVRVSRSDTRNELTPIHHRFTRVSPRAVDSGSFFSVLGRNRFLKRMGTNILVISLETRSFEMVSM